jgi:hypothetical protein
MKRNLSVIAVVSLAAAGGTGLWLAAQGANAAATAAALPEGAAPRAEAATKPNGAAESRARIERGRHLVLTSGCNDCHTPWKMGASGPEPDMTRMLSGHPESMELPPAPAAAPPWLIAAVATNTAWAGPWGVSFTANLTPDKETGLGSWTQTEFVQTIRTGRHLGRGRPVLPPMPIPAYSNFTDEELAAIFAYLRSIPALKNRVPQPIVPDAQQAQG